MTLRLATLTASLLLTMTVCGFSQNYITQQTGGFIPTPPINSPIRDPFVRKETYSTVGMPDSRNKNTGRPLGTYNTNMSSGGQVNRNNFITNGTLNNPSTFQPRLRNR